MRGSLLYFFHAAAPPVSLWPRVTRQAAEGGPLHSPRRITALACYALSQSALPLAQRLADCLAVKPWGLPGQLQHPARPAQPSEHPAPGKPSGLSRVEIFAPSRFCPAGVTPFEKIGSLLAATYKNFAAHAFIGATGIAVRALAPLLAHKSTDAPVIVLDPAGQHVISLLSGHWGGANELASHVAHLLGATPVITTASDTASITPGAGTNQTRKSAAALDMLLRDAGLLPVDWNRLPGAQAAMIEGESLGLWDPCHAVPDHPLLQRLPAGEAEATPPEHCGPLVAAHWRELAPSPAILRVAVPRLVIGLGCRKNAPSDMVETATRKLLAAQGLEPLAVAALATVKEKLQEPALLALAERMGVPLHGFESADLARCPTPNPSAAAGRRFKQPPFSVCEAAALLAAAQIFPAGAPRLLLPKTIEQGQLTLALAISDRIER